MAGTSTSESLPYYLWDIEAKQTVEVRELNEAPEYTCVSHTWGRWKIENEFHRLEGVSWEIPGNRVFNVPYLPKILNHYRQSFTIRFVWFDLLCIPQKTDNPILRERGDAEIARQAEIFGGSIACIAWLNYIVDWEFEKYSLDWLSLAYLRTSVAPGIYSVEDILEQVHEHAKNPIQLLQHPSHNRILGNEFKANPFFYRLLRSLAPQYAIDLSGWNKPSAWFSSLWILQEAYFCPHIMLMNRYWEPLCDTRKSPCHSATYYSFS